MLFKPVVKVNTRITKVHLDYNICNIKNCEEIDEMTKRNVERNKNRKVVDIRRDHRSIRKGKIVSFKKNICDDEAFREIDEEMEKCQSIIE